MARRCYRPLSESPSLPEGNSLRNSSLFGWGRKSLPGWRFPVRVPFGPTKTESDRLRNYGEPVNRKDSRVVNGFVHFQVASD